ncbi:MAG: AMIN domain-containing protein, partial [Janthinobacterium lividum]
MPQTPWQVAESARQQLLAIPVEGRTREDYSTVMDAYRLIYHDSAGDPHATEAIFDVALLLGEQGSALHDAKASRDAIGQFEFLRTQYPHSQFRTAALLQEAQIAAQDLHDVKLARAKYAAFVEEYPQSSHADEAQAALKSLRAGVLPAVARPQGTGNAMETVATRSAAAASNGVAASAVSPELHAEASLAASQGTVQQPVPVVSAVPAGSPLTQQGGASGRPPRSSTVNTAVPGMVGEPVQDAAANVPAHTRSGLATVSAIRHWSTPTYTRVAIDLGDEVQYEAARVPSPDRIYFDLHGTRLAQELAGKSFTVTDDGFLKRIRAAQYSNDMTRVVLDVNDVTEYSA